MRVPLPLSVAYRFWRHEPRKLQAASLAYTTLALRVGPRRNGGVPISVTGPDGIVTGLTVWDYIDMLVVRELFVDADYRVPGGFAPMSILDLGANVGISARYFRSQFPDAEIIAVEADPALILKLRHNCSDPKITTIHAAVMPDSGPVTFYSAPEGWVSSIEPSAGAMEVVVDGLTVPDILSRSGRNRVDLVKLDVEGSEWPLLEQGALQQVTDCIVGELHTDPNQPGRSVADARRLLTGFDVTVHSDKPNVPFTATRA